VIAREGLPRATFARIAAEAGLSSPGMISYHFTDKDELLGSVVDAVLRDCLASIEEAVVAAPDPPAALAAYLTAFVRWQDTHREEVAALWLLASSWRRPDGRAAFEEDVLRAPLVGILADGQRTGAFRPVPADWVAQTILCAVEGFQEALRQDPEIEAEVFARALVDLFDRGLRP